VRDVASGSTGLSLAYTGYDAYGNPTTSGGLTSLTPVGFQGGYTDSTGLVYFEQRYYDPGTGQFTSLDPLNKMTNAGCTFDKDNPFSYSDPTGTIACGAGPYCSSSGADSAHDQAVAASENPPTGQTYDAESKQATSTPISKVSRAQALGCSGTGSSTPSTETVMDCRNNGTPYSIIGQSESVNWSSWWDANSNGILQFLDALRHNSAATLDEGRHILHNLSCPAEALGPPSGAESSTLVAAGQAISYAGREILFYTKDDDENPGIAAAAQGFGYFLLAGGGAFTAGGLYNAFIQC
jgi:RHS repeat-associated protein